MFPLRSSGSLAHCIHPAHRHTIWRLARFVHQPIGSSHLVRLNRFMTSATMASYARTSAYVGCKRAINILHYVRHDVEVSIAHSCTHTSQTMAEGSTRGHSAIFLSPRTSQLRASVISYGSDQVDGVRDKAHQLAYECGCGCQFSSKSPPSQMGCFNVP